MSVAGHRVTGAPFACADGRIYDVVNIEVQEGGAGTCERRCTIEVDERTAEDGHAEFMCLIYAEAFARGACTRDVRDIVGYALNCAVLWLEAHPSLPIAHRHGRPIVIDCR
jgi:hypothetical protein